MGYKIEKTFYGYKLIFEGTLEEEETKQWAAEFRKKNISGNFSMLVDMCFLCVLKSAARKIMAETQAQYCSFGM